MTDPEQDPAVRADADEVRPRFGQLVRADGEEIPLVFHPVEGEPGLFLGRAAGDESSVVIRPGDNVRVDVLGAGQSVRFYQQT